MLNAPPSPARLLTRRDQLVRERERTLLQVDLLEAQQLQFSSAASDWSQPVQRTAVDQLLAYAARLERTIARLEV